MDHVCILHDGMVIFSTHSVKILGYEVSEVLGGL